MDLADTTLGSGLAVLRTVPEGPPLPGEARASAAARAGTRADGTGVYIVRGGVTTLGRGLHNDVILIDASVSREHARLLFQDGAWAVENRSARHPLWVGARRVEPGARAPLVPGDRLRLGHTTLELLAPERPPAADPATGGTDLHLFDPGVTLRFALSARLPRRARWALAALAVALVVLVAVLTLGTADLVGRAALAVGGAGSILAALTVPLVPALGAAVLVALVDRYEREPVVVLAAAFAWGGLIAIPAALFAERALAAWLPGPLGGIVLDPAHILAHSAWQGLSAGLVEESVKGAGLLVLLLALRDEFDNVTDGIVYGVLIGAGFAMVENIVYFAGAPRDDLGFLILGRVVLGWLGHSTFTALFGAGLGYARETRDRRLRLRAPLLGFVAAVLLHSLFDFVDFQANAAAHLGRPSPGVAAAALAAALADYLPLFAAQALLLRLLIAALRREAATVREYLAGEVAAGVVTPDEYAILQDASQRARVERHYLLARGPRAYLAARALHQTAIGLAFRKWHVAMGDRPKPGPRQPEEAYRERIARLRRALARAVGALAAQSASPPS